MSFYAFNEDDFSGKFDVSQWCWYAGDLIDNSKLCDAVSNALENSLKDDMCFAVECGWEYDAITRFEKVSWPAVFQLSFSENVFNGSRPTWTVSFEDFSKNFADETPARRSFFANQFRKMADMIEALPD